MVIIGQKNIEDFDPQRGQNSSNSVFDKGTKLLCLTLNYSWRARGILLSCYQLVNGYYTLAYIKAQQSEDGMTDSIRTGVGEILETGCNSDNFTNNFNQLNMFRAIISPILRSTRLCLQFVV